MIHDNFLWYSSLKVSSFFTCLALESISFPRKNDEVRAIVESEYGGVVLSCTTRHTHAVIVAEMGITPIRTKNSSDPYQIRPILRCTHNTTLRLVMPSCPCIRVVLLVDVSHVEMSHVKTAFCVCCVCCRAPARHR